MAKGEGVGEGVGGASPLAHVPARLPHPGMPGLGDASLQALEVRNEFAAVRVALDRAANGPRLRVDDLETGASVYLDAFVLRTLAVLPPGGLEALCRASLPHDHAPPGGGPPGDAAG